MITTNMIWQFTELSTSQCSHLQVAPHHSAHTFRWHMVTTDNYLNYKILGSLIDKDILELTLSEISINGKPATTRN